MAHLQTRISTPESLHALSIARDQIVRNNAEIGLFDPNQVHDACGVAAFARKDGRPTNELIELALQGLTRMEHRGACGCDPDSSDGAGILTQIPHEFFARIVPNLPAAGQYGVATLFMPRSDYQAVKDLVRSIVTAEGLEAIHWRELGVDDSSIGFEAKRAQPVTAQLFVSRPDNIRAAEYEKLLYFLQKRIRKECVSEQAPLSAGNLYCCSFSSKSIVYKGLCLPSRLGQYFDDLKQPDFASSLAIVHSRFATNALPQWPLAHPYRVLAHNGEINTVQGNRNVMGSLDRLFASTLFGERAEDVGQMVSQVGSDTRSLDGALQLLIHGGLSLEHGLRVLIPEAFEGRKDLSPEARAFYRYHSGLMSPWDGPASVVASDGERLAAVSDRNGLRPQRLVETNSGLLVIASEDGIIDIEPGDIKRRAAGTAGGMFAFSPDTGLRTSDEVIEELFRKDPELYREAETRRVMLAPSFKSSPDPDNELSSERRRFLQRAFGYTEEDLRILIAPLVIDGEQPLGSMGDDTPLAVLSTQARPLFDYFKQLFAQVTNPPIDPIREEHVTSLTTHLGPKGNILLPDAKNGELIELASPLLSHADISAVREIAEQRERFRIETLDLTFDVGKPGALKAALNNLCRQAEEAVRNGTGILTLSDKAVDENRAAIPSLLATSALHQHLSRKGIRHSTSIVVESGEPREVHHFACLLGFGADAVHPYLLLDQLKEYADFAGNDPEKAQYNGIKALNKGLLKTMAKMGISPVASYRGALLFEAVGISKELADRHFGHVTSRVGGINLIDIERDVLFHHENATRPRASLESELLAGGKYQQHRHGEDHAISDPLIRSLQKAVRIGPDKWEGIQEWIKFKSYADAEQSRPRHLRDCLSFKFADSPLDLSQVEPVESILRRFTSGAMSLGSISAVAHETLARAMNRIGGRSNSGEGGEPVERRTDAERKSKIRQVASGRFGVSTHYLATAEEIQIKIAQGAKPGEGGELRGGKVTAFIAATRNTTPGVTLISPPPHHDIYSIEDLKQLIHDLRQVNPKAVISVKLVSAPGVGTVAAGVAKAGADRIIVSGSEGGTGASPLSSVKHAGSPQELGIAEAHQVLIHEGFRPKVSLQTDGQILTGRDAVVAFALGADEVAFSTAPLVSMGCDMMRVCHTGTCPVGIATQDAELIKKFQGEVEQVINYFRLVAEEVRSYLAKLGLKSVDELVGRTELLVQNPPTENSKHGKLDLGPLLHKPASEHLSFEEFRRQSAESDHSRHIARAARPLLERQSGRTVEYDLGEVSNADLAIGSQVSGQISQTYGEFGLPEGAELRVKMHGEAGQSFGAWLAGGVTLELSGVANDYVGKGLSGGCIVVKPQQEASSIAAAPHDHAIAGNTTFYGAIRGKAFLNGKVGERFAIRNSGATLVCEGTGGNACEYMTGGVAVVLGDTGPNPFAGMSGGMAYLLAEDKSKVEKLWQVGQKRSMVVRQIALSDDPVLRQIVEEHAERTGSPRAKTLLSNMEQPVFLQFVPEAITAVKRSEQSDSRTLPVLGSAH